MDEFIGKLRALAGDLDAMSATLAMWSDTATDATMKTIYRRQSARCDVNARGMRSLAGWIEKTAARREAASPEEERR